ncbi:F0F1 ATP synthase subunit beta, partial [Acinetobacter baumannii]
AGEVLAVRGAVVDVVFEPGGLPPVDEALRVDWDRGEPLVVEVQSHLDERTVRGVALQSTEGLRRGTQVQRTGEAITVPVGDEVLGRVLDVCG